MTGLDRLHIVTAHNWKSNKAASHPAFYQCADAKLEAWLMQHFGWDTIPGELRLSSTLKHFVQGLLPGAVTTWQSDILVGRSRHPCRVCYRTLSGNVYYPHLLPNCEDLEFWIEDLDSNAVLNSLKSLSG